MHYIPPPKFIALFLVIVDVLIVVKVNYTDVNLEAFYYVLIYSITIAPPSIAELLVNVDDSILN